MFKKPDEKSDTTIGVAPKSLSPAQAKAAQSRSTPKPSTLTPAVQPPVQDTANAGATMISADLTIIGNVYTKGRVILDGDIEGDMHCESLVVGENGDIRGGIIANEVTVLGRVMGSIRGNKVMLQSTSHVEGDIFHQGIGIEMGTVFDGSLKRTDNPTAGMSTPDDVKNRMKAKSSASR
ncbi:MAG: bactofilin family protein [Methyloligellaceae bacterium]